MGLDISSLPHISPVIGFVIIAVGFLVVIVLQSREDRQWREVLGTAREFISRAEIRVSQGKSPRKQVRDTLGPFLGRVAIRTEVGVPLREAMKRVAESFPPNVFTTMIIDVLEQAQSSPTVQFYALLFEEARKLEYDPLTNAMIKLLIVSSYGGNISYSLKTSARRANRVRMHELKLAAQKVQMKMSALAVFCLLPSLMLITVVPQMVQAMRMFSENVFR